MNRKRCILKSGSGFGSRIFYYEVPESEYETFNKEFVKLFDRIDAERPIRLYSRKQILDVPDSIGQQLVCGIHYPEWRWFHSIKDKWYQQGKKVVL